jgi:uncharacterized protein (UPF0262 family)
VSAESLRLALKLTEDLSYEEVEALPPSDIKAIEYGLRGLHIDGEHHKQWIIEEMLRALGVDLSVYAADREPGIPA